MKRVGMITLGLMVVVLAVTGGVALARGNATTKNPADVNNAPPIVLPGNAAKAPNQLLQEAQLNRVPPAEAKPVKKELMKWADAEKLLGVGSTPWIARDRQVWLLQVYYPNGTDTKAGFIPDALITEVIDAETGQSIITRVERQNATP